MRNITFIKPALLFALLLFFPIMAGCQNRILSEFPSGKGITKTYVSKYMIDKNKDYLFDSHESSLKDIDGLEGIDLNNLTGIEVYNCKNLNVFRAVVVLIKKMLEEYDAKPLIMNEDGLLISGIFILYKNNKEIGVAIIDSNEKEPNITILHGKLFGF